MSNGRLEERVAALERQFITFLADHSGTGRIKDWKRTRGAFTGDDFMKQVFAEGHKIRRADQGRARSRTAKRRRSHS
jgi:hypothetical protein